VGLYGLLLGALCVWRITHLLTAEDGPGDVLVHLRRSAGNGFWGRLLDCFYCLSLWVAVPFALLLAEGWREGLLSWLAFSAGAILLERATGARPAPYLEDEEDDHDLLRQAEDAVSGDRTDPPAGRR
jgi:hypothetical protein